MLRTSSISSTPKVVFHCRRGERDQSDKTCISRPESAFCEYCGWKQKMRQWNGPRSISVQCVSERQTLPHLFEHSVCSGEKGRETFTFNLFSSSRRFLFQSEDRGSARHDDNSSFWQQRSEDRKARAEGETGFRCATRDEDQSLIIRPRVRCLIKMHPFPWKTLSPNDTGSRIITIILVALFPPLSKGSNLNDGR